MRRPELQTVSPVGMSNGSSTVAPPAAPSAEDSARSGSRAAQCPDNQQREQTPAAEPVSISSGKKSVSQRTSSTEAIDPRQAASDQLFLAGATAAAPSKPLQLEVPASGVMQSSAVQPPRTPAGAAPGAARPLGSFLGKSLAEASTARASPSSQQLSTRQAQEVANAAAAGTYVHKQTGALSVQEGWRSSIDGDVMPSSTAAAVANAIENVRANTLQPPTTSEHAPVR